MAISENLKRIYATSPNNIFYVEALSLFHSEINAGNAIHITNRPVRFQAHGSHPTQPAGFDYWFEPAPFAVTLPKQDDTGTADMSITISNADTVRSGTSNMSIIERLELIATKPMEALKVYYRIYISSGGTVNTAEQLDPALRLDVLGFQIANATVAMTASKANLFNRSFPARVYDTVDFPGLR